MHADLGSTHEQLVRKHAGSAFKIGAAFLWQLARHLQRHPPPCLHSASACSGISVPTTLQMRALAGRKRMHCCHRCMWPRREKKRGGGGGVEGLACCPSRDCCFASAWGHTSKINVNPPLEPKALLILDITLPANSEFPPIWKKSAVLLIGFCCSTWPGPKAHVTPIPHVQPA